MHKCNFIYTHEKSMAFPQLQCRGHTYEFHENHFMTHTEAQQHYVQMLYDKFLPNWRIRLGSTDRNSLMPISKM